MTGGLHTVALVGVDGAGKTTQAELLRRELEARGAVVMLAHPYGRKVPVARRPREVRVKRRRERLLIALADLAEMWAYLWLVFLRARLAARHRAVWVVGDRSFEDLIVKHDRRGDVLAWLLKLARRLAPRFQRTVWLDVDPTVARARDGEFDPSYYAASRAAYARWARTGRWQVLAAQGAAPERVYERVREVLGVGCSG